VQSALGERGDGRVRPYRGMFYIKPTFGRAREQNAAAGWCGEGEVWRTAYSLDSARLRSRKDRPK
jgi:hypothetical protein